MACLALVGTVGLAAAYVLLVHTTTGQRLDGSALEHRFAVSRGSADRMEHLLDAISARSVLLADAVLVGLAALRRRLVRAVGAVVALGGAAVAARALKDDLLTRTDLGGFGGVAYNTFPSGHATVGVALGLALVMVTPARLAWLSAGVAAIAVPVVGTATVATGGHRPSDSVGAYLSALAWFSACAAMVVWFERSGAPATASDRAAPPWRHLAAAVGAASVALVVLLVQSLAGDGRRGGASAGSYVLGVLGIDVVGVGVVLAFAAVLHGHASSPRTPGPVRPRTGSVGSPHVLGA